METSSCSEEAVLSATARAARQIGQLPGAPTPDWGQRLAEVLTGADPATYAEVVVGTAGSPGPTFECRGSSVGSWVENSEHGPDLRRRQLVRGLTARLAESARAGVWPVADVLGPDDRAARWAGPAHAESLVAWYPIPVESDSSVRALLAHWTAPQARLGLGPGVRRSVLRSLLPLIGERLRLAVGGTVGRSSWLSVCEQRVLELLTAGLTIQEIADQLGRSQHTIHDHVKRIHRKLGTRSRGSLIARSLGAWAAPRVSRPTLAFPGVGRCSFVSHSGW